MAARTSSTVGRAGAHGDGSSDTDRFGAWLRMAVIEDVPCHRAVLVGAELLVQTGDRQI